MMEMMMKSKSDFRERNMRTHVHINLMKSDFAYGVCGKHGAYRVLLPGVDCPFCHKGFDGDLVDKLLRPLKWERCCECGNDLFEDYRPRGLCSACEKKDGSRVRSFVERE